MIRCRYEAARSLDRHHAGVARYPRVHYPEMYLLHGGYSTFYRAHPHLCEPRAYRRMDDSPFKEQRKQCDTLRKVPFDLDFSFVYTLPLTSACRRRRRRTSR